MCHKHLGQFSKSKILKRPAGYATVGSVTTLPRISILVIHDLDRGKYYEVELMYVSTFAGFSLGLIPLILILFALLQWLNIDAGSFLDWVIGGATFWWLLVIVTVPWNIHFQAREVLVDAEQSTEKNMPVDRKKVTYVQRLASRSLIIAIALHLISAIGLYALAITGISVVGYVGSGAALLLTLLRPAVRAYEFIATRLSMIQQEVKYPREDVIELRHRVTQTETDVKYLLDQFNAEQPDSWVSTQARQLQAIRNDLTRLSSSVEELRSTNQAEHQRLSREAQNAIAQLSTDGQFLDHVREIIRFFKTA
jgi:hypothetical protein